MIVYFDVLMNVMKSIGMINFDGLINIIDQMFITTKKKKKKKKSCIADVLLQETTFAKRKLSMSKIIDISNL
jgi:phage anti-repressor protein